MMVVCSDLLDASVKQPPLGPGNVESYISNETLKFLDKCREELYVEEAEECVRLHFAEGSGRDPISTSLLGSTWTAMQT